MKIARFFLINTLSAAVILAFAQGPDTLWTKTLGFDGDDAGYAVDETFDGGYIVVGYAQVPPTRDYEMYLIKTNAAGDTLWTRAFGGVGSDYGYSVQQTSDSGYVAAGVTRSFSAGNGDYYVVKTDFRGDTLWTRTFGGNDDDYCNSIRQTFDGGYIIGGWTLSFGAANGDAYLVKTNDKGDTTWTRRYVGSQTEEIQSVIQTSDSGYVLVGNFRSIATYLSDVYLVRTNSLGDTLWTKTYGGLANDFGNSVQQTSDGGFIIAGYTLSFGAGGNDFYLIKTDANGNKQWTKTFGGSSDEFCWSVEKTSDGGYILAGYGSFYGSNPDMYLVKTDNAGNPIWIGNYGGTASEKGMAAQQTADGRYIIVGGTNSFGAGGNDIYLVKTGCFIDTLWTNTVGGAGNDQGFSVQQTTDSGYVIAGNTNSFGGTKIADSSDVYLIKLDTHGNEIWTKTYGGTGYDQGSSIEQTSDGGYIITGSTNSFTSDYDIYLIKTNSAGDTNWTRRYGGIKEEQGNDIQQTSDGGYIITGSTNSFSNDKDVYLIKIDASGDTNWTKHYGGSGEEQGYSVQETSDGGYIITGVTYLVDNYNVYLVKTDALGNVSWTKDYGSVKDDGGYSVDQTIDGGYVITGYTDRFNNRDVYIIKVNEYGDSVWTTILEEAGDDQGNSIQQTSDGGYIIAGYTNSYGPGDYDVYLIKVNPLGEVLTTDLYGGSNDDKSYSVQQTSDGGYIIAGYTNSYGSGDNDVFVIKTEKDNFTNLKEQVPVKNSFLKLNSSPNPFKNHTMITYNLIKRSYVIVNVYNLLGQSVKTLDRQLKGAGKYQIVWDGKDNHNRMLTTGVYFLRLEIIPSGKTDKAILNSKLLLIR